LAKKREFGIPPGGEDQPFQQFSEGGKGHGGRGSGSIRPICASTCCAARSWLEHGGQLVLVWVADQ
jgi:hypothetical protein